MTTQSIQICSSDYEQLNLRLSLAPGARRPGSVLEALRIELDRAAVVPDNQLPPNVVRIGSHVRVRDLDSNEIDAYTLTLPEKADPGQGRISVLAPLGLALLGYAEGDELSWVMPGGLRRLRLLEVR